MNLLTEHIHDFAKQNQVKLLVLLLEYEHVRDPDVILRLLDALSVRKN